MRLIGYGQFMLAFEINLLVKFHAEDSRLVLSCFENVMKCKDGFVDVPELFRKRGSLVNL